MRGNEDLVNAIIVKLASEGLEWDYAEDQEDPYFYAAMFDGWYVWRDTDTDDPSEACGVYLGEDDRIPFTPEQYKRIEKAIDNAWRTHWEGEKESIMKRAREVILGHATAN